MQLARELGGMTLEEMLERMSSAEILMWMALYAIEDEDKEVSKSKQDMLRSFGGR
jgi:hypothetical protein